jgi:hypothetical protein
MSPDVRTWTGAVLEQDTAPRTTLRSPWSDSRLAGLASVASPSDAARTPVL